jgi:hypothetical protein
VDWNSDGDADLISGDRSGYLNVFVWDDTGLVSYKQYKKTDSTPLNVGANSQPFTLDWNGDGMKDLITGCQNGDVQVWRNVTSDTWPMFERPEPMMAAGEPINIYRVNPVIFDLDCDGLNDLLCGANDGYVRFYRNIGSNEFPDLQAAETLKTVSEQYVQASGTAVGQRCWFGFWDSDTVPDILLSAYDGTVELFRGVFLTGVEERTPTPVCLALRVGPNPSAGRSMIACEAPTRAELVVCDNLGRVVRHLGVLSGRSVQTWDGRSDSGAELSSGVYFCRLTGSGQTATSRIVVSR